MNPRKRSSFNDDEVEFKDADSRKKSKPPLSIYKGINNYTDHRAGFRRENNHVVGPSKRCSSAYITASTTYDYQPGICKDYKETGYCGYGDSCKFLYDRSDYKTGSQIEKEYEYDLEKSNKANKSFLDNQHDNDDDNNDKDNSSTSSLTLASCGICNNTSFVNPVVTKCKHYFCERCALKHNSKTKRCFVCNQPTQGIFNVARHILKKMAADRPGATHT